MATTPERAAALVVRAWLEPGAPAREAFRARVTYRLDLEAEDETVLLPAKPDEVLAAVSGWLDGFLAARGRGA